VSLILKVLKIRALVYRVLISSSRSQTAKKADTTEKVGCLSSAYIRDHGNDGSGRGDIQGSYLRHLLYQIHWANDCGTNLTKDSKDKSIGVSLSSWSLSRVAKSSPWQRHMSRDEGGRCAAAAQPTEPDWRRAGELLLP